MGPPTKLRQFHPPAFLNDLTTDSNRQEWSKKISDFMNLEKSRSSLPQFFNGTVTAYDQSADHQLITWIGFPKNVTGPQDKRWEKADSSRGVQDEFLEWSVLRDKDQNISSVTFTCEVPEYWEFLVEKQPEDAFKLIKRMNSPLLDDAKMESIFDKDNSGKWKFNKNNSNNSTVDGIIICLCTRSNTLSTEFEVVPQATIIRKDSQGKDVTDKVQLTKCSGNGNPGRNSDPAINAGINELVRRGWSVSIADPVALYMHSFDTSGLSLDISGKRKGVKKIAIPDSWIELQRGSSLGRKVPLGLRLRIRNNNGLKTSDGTRLLDVSDIWDATTLSNIKYGAQFADRIMMSIAGVVGEQVGRAEAQSCVSET